MTVIIATGTITTNILTDRIIATTTASGILTGTIILTEICNIREIITVFNREVQIEASIVMGISMRTSMGILAGISIDTRVILIGILEIPIGVMDLITVILMDISKWVTLTFVIIILFVILIPTTVKGLPIAIVMLMKGLYHEFVEVNWYIIRMILMRTIACIVIIIKLSQIQKYKVRWELIILSWEMAILTMIRFL